MTEHADPCQSSRHAGVDGLFPGLLGRFPAIVSHRRPLQPHSEMKIDNPSPFEGFDCYLNFHSGLGRHQVCLKSKETGARKTMLLSKFKMSVMIGRELSRCEEVDHKDGNKLNDNESNLEIVTKKENIRRHKMTLPPKSMLSMVCPCCGVGFSRERRKTHVAKGGLRTFCTRACSTRFYAPGRSKASA